MINSKTKKSAGFRSGSYLKYISINIVETLLRMLPVPCKTGLIKIGNPDRNSPVFLTCNYHLTVERVKRALEGMDCYLLIANSNGINVWCAATGGHLTNHDVISVLKTSGVEELVNHRKVILPQLAATGVEARVIKQRTGWEVIWGPVYANDIPAFMEVFNSKIEIRKIREVEFSLQQRIEMAAAWAFPISIVFSVIMLLVWPEVILPLSLMIWALSYLIFLAFPLYSKFLSTSEGKRIGFVFFDFGRGGFQLILWGMLVLGIVVYGYLASLTPDFILRWSMLSLAIVLILSMDLMGSTPVYKSGLHKDRLFKVVLDKEKCRGVGFCEQVCPRGCYKLVKLDKTRKAILDAGKCVRCGACIVQCPFDAIRFKTPEGEITPETIRKFKLNLMGKRAVKVG